MECISKGFQTAPVFNSIEIIPAYPFYGEGSLVKFHLIYKDNHAWSEKNQNGAGNYSEKYQAGIPIPAA